MKRLDSPAEMLMVAALALFALLVAVAAGLGAVAGGLFGQGVPRLDLAGYAQVTFGLFGNLDNPAMAWPVSQRHLLPEPRGFVYAAALMLAVVLVVTVAVVRVLRARARRTPGSRVQRLGAKSDAWAPATYLNKEGLLTRAPEPGRVVLGTTGRRLLASYAEHSTLVVGASRSGKTTGLAVPSLVDWHGPAIVCSTKTDLLITRHARAERGRVLVFDPTGITGQPSDGWSPLARSVTWRGALRSAATLASLSKLDKGGENNAFFMDRVRNLLAPLLLAAAADGRDMGAVVSWVKAQNMTEASDILIRVAAEDPDVMTGVESLGAFADLEDSRTRENIALTVGMALSAYEDPDVVKTSRSWDITPDALLDGPNTLYVVASETDQRRLAPLVLSLLDEMTSAILHRAQLRRADDGRAVPYETQRVLLLMDEAANIAPLPNLAALASTGPGEGLTLVTLLQDLDQLRQRYPTEWASIFNNHQAKVALPGITSPETLSTFVKVIGQEDLKEKSTSHATDKTGRNVSESVRARDVISPRELRELKPGSGVAVVGNHPPIRFRLRPWYDDDTMRARLTPATTPDVDEPYGPPQNLTAAQAAQWVENGPADIVPGLPGPPLHVDSHYYVPTDDGHGYRLVTNPSHIRILDRARTEVPEAEAAVKAATPTGGNSND